MSKIKDATLAEEQQNNEFTGPEPEAPEEVEYVMVDGDEETQAPSEQAMTIPRDTIAIEKETPPDEALEAAQKKAQALMKAVNTAGLSYNLGGKKPHLGIEAWQILGRFDNATPRVVDTTRLADGDTFVGYEAKAEVYKNGNIISSADAMCTRDEPNWNNRKGTPVPEFQLRSMAQTRAASKALRMAYGWIAVLAGYSATPMEEMTGDEYGKQEEAQAPKMSPSRQAQAAQAPGETCPKCGNLLTERNGKYGPFMGCSSYPSCKFILKDKN